MSEITTYTISHADGRPDQAAGSYDEALRLVEQTYGGEIVCCAHWDGANHDGSAERQLVWTDEAAAANDAGRKSVCEIIRRSAVDGHDCDRI
ncbi:MAG: hypothetical protein ACYCQK_01530 [Acidiferrobacteraceae bacterium]